MVVASPFGNKSNPFGSSKMSGYRDIWRAGMFEQTPTSIFAGQYAGRDLWYSGAAGALLVGGARLGKLSSLLYRVLCRGAYDGGSLVYVDPRGEGACLSYLQVLKDGTAKSVVCVNPEGKHGLPQHTLNPTDYLRKDSRTLISDLKVFWENWLPDNGGKDGLFFSQRGRQVGEDLSLALINRDGTLILPELYRVINWLVAGGQRWIDFAYEHMHCSGIERLYDAEEAIAGMRQDRAGGFPGILGELEKSVGCLSDPLLSDQLKPPFDFQLKELCRDDHFTQLYLIVPVEMISIWAPVLKSIFVGAMIEKARRPQAPEQLWIIDECGNMGRFPLIPKMFTYGAGIGVKPYAVFQSVGQMAEIGPNAEQLITSSAGLQMYLPARDLKSARHVSDILGTETLDLEDDLTQVRANAKRTQLMAGILSGADPFAAFTEMAQLNYERSHTRQIARDVRKPDEVMRTERSGVYGICDGLQNPYYGQRTDYWLRRDMAGSFLPNPYYPPLGSVLLRTFWGMRRRKVITEPVPDHLSHLPQYQSGLMSYIEGHKP